MAPRRNGLRAGVGSAPESAPRRSLLRAGVCSAPESAPRRSRLQSHHFHTVSAIDHSKSRSQGNNISLPPITKLTLFYLVLHIYSYSDSDIVIVIVINMYNQSYL